MEMDRDDRPRKSLAWLSALTLLVSILISAPPVHAQPPEPATGLTLSWPALGLSNDLNLAGANNNQDATVPVPAGFTPRRLTGLMRAPMNFGPGFMEIRDSRGTVVSAVDLPPVTSGQAVTPFDVDISAAQVERSSLRLTFTVRQVDSRGQICGPEQKLGLTDLATLFDGTDTPPVTVAGFFPPVLQRVTIYTPVGADRAEQQAVLTVASAVARQYQPQPTAVTVVTQPRGAQPPPAPPLTRAVVVERGDVGLDIVNTGAANAFLRVSGSGEQLDAQVSLLSNRLQSLAQVPRAQVTQAGSRGGDTADTRTFGQLNISGEIPVLRSSDLVVGADRAALGPGRIDTVQVHLLANYTPVAPQDSGALMVTVNGRALYTAPLDNTGQVDAVFDIPNDVLAQRINLTFTVTYTPWLQCTPTLAPLTFQLDPRSTFTMWRGGQAGAAFDALPSEFSPDFLVALDGTNPRQLDYAARVVVAMSRLTSTTLTPRVVDIDDAVGADTGALIVADGAAIGKTSLRPPLGGDGASVNVDLPEELRADIDRGLGSIQVLADDEHNRTVVLVTTSGDWSLVEPVLDYVDGLPAGWSSLSGNVVAAGAAGIVTDLTLGSATAAPSPGDSQPQSSGAPSWGVWVTVAAVCVLVALAAALWWRRRRPRTSDDW